ncbi:MAG: hypothetical protein KGJ06_07030 [Pseudomonadota bacterium]|nr:hypothetical protein [Pseudomonadota bacterium]
MTLDQLAQIITVLSLAVLAWSAWNYVYVKKHELHREHYQRFFEVTEHLGKTGGSIASKMAAAFELRKFPEYTDVIIRLMENTNVTGEAAQMLKNEMQLTANFLKSHFR